MNERRVVLEGRILFPLRGEYHVTRWWSDGSTTEHWEPGPAVVRPFPLYF